MRLGSAMPQPPKRRLLQTTLPRSFSRCMDRKGLDAPAGTA